MESIFEDHIHIPVMPDEVMNYLKPSDGMTIVDATVGEGGHSKIIARSLSRRGRLICCDRDKEIIEIARRNLANVSPGIEFIHADYRTLPDLLPQMGVETVDGILLDLGASRYHYESPDRGFSFRLSGRLDMRFDRSGGITAFDVVNSWDENRLEKIFREYGEERYSRQIVKAITAHRRKKAIETTDELREIILDAVKVYKDKIDPATRVFQALRIAVNDELSGLGEFIKGAVSMLNRGGKMVVITFHSLEDRIIKEEFRLLASGCVCPPSFPKCICNKVPQVKVLTKKPVMAGETEIRINPRSRSAKLRACERI